MLHQHFLQSPVRARSAAAAKLFFIPVYLGRYFNFYWQQWSEEGDAWAITSDCRGMEAEPCWMEKWERAQNVRRPGLAVLGLGISLRGLWASHPKYH